MKFMICTTTERMDVYQHRLEMSDSFRYLVTYDSAPRVVPHDFSARFFDAPSLVFIVPVLGHRPGCVYTLICVSLNSMFVPRSAVMFGHLSCNH